MNAGSPASVPELESLKAQLIRYAEDMEELMQQHSRLQEQHQMILQSMGREIHTDDLILNVLTASAPISMVTDQRGHILHVSQSLHTPAAARKELRASPQFQAQLRRLSASVPSQSGLLCRLIASESGVARSVSYDALALQRRAAGKIEIHWLMELTRPEDSGTNLFLGRLVHGADKDSGMILASPHGTIMAVNEGFCCISGYQASELLHGNPRMLSSGRHGAGFYQKFWLELLEKGSWSGTLFNRRKGGQIFLEWQTVRMVEDEAGRVVGYLASATDLSYSDPSATRLQKLAYTDPLTELPNRRKLVDFLGQRLGEPDATEQALAVLFIDLNRFKPINDELGHEVGDVVLKEVARRMANVLEPTDLLARVGGDEFVVVLCDAGRASQAPQIAQQLQQALLPAIPVGNHRLKISGSMGCAVYPKDAQDIESLLKNADTAMYVSKRKAIAFCAFDPSMNGPGEVNLDLDLWQALDRGEISMVYQPQIRTGGQSLRGCEALMRWHHPTAGDIEPTVFIAIAERTGAILHLGSWALAHACEQLQSWRQSGMPDLTMSLNVSLRQLRDIGFANQVEAVLADKQIPTHLLELELSESQASLLTPVDNRVIGLLRKLGVRIAIDDFGSSFNSIARLNALPISCLKINSECVQNLTRTLDARAISTCMIAIGRAMGIEVIAQGVESEAQAELLSEQGCRVIQGFYAGHPVSADTLAQMVEAL